jgi:hypothetical protein
MKPVELFRNKKREYLREKVNELETNSKNKTIRDLYGNINEFKKGYQSRTNLEKVKNDDLLAFPTVFRMVGRITSVNY